MISRRGSMLFVDFEDRGVAAAPPPAFPNAGGEASLASTMPTAEYGDAVGTDFGRGGGARLRDRGLDGRGWSHGIRHGRGGDLLHRADGAGSGGGRRYVLRPLDTAAVWTPPSAPAVPAAVEVPAAIEVLGRAV
ncbi:MAG: hypothetical protein R3E53_14790 [Myxococcota bacterium]